MAIPGFIFGAGTGVTPEELANQRRWAQAMIRSGTERTPQDPWEGLASLARAVSGNYADFKAGEEETKQRGGAADRFNSLFQPNNSAMGTASGGEAPKVTPVSYSPEEQKGAPGLPDIGKAWLGAVAGPESAGKYDVLYGGTKFADLSAHPGANIPITSGPNKGKTSSAAGKYQFLKPTWEEQQKKLNLPDFSPGSQDAAAWNLSKEVYQAKTGGDLEADLAKADDASLQKIAGLMSGTWTSLPGGIEQGIDGQGFVKSFRQNQGAGPGAVATAQQPVRLAQASGPGLNELLRAYSDPWASDEQKSVLQMYIQQEMQKADPARRQQLEKGQLEIDALKNPPSEYGFEVLPDGRMVRTDKRKGTATPIMQSEQKPTNDMQNYEAYAVDERAAGRQPLGRLEYERALKKAGATNINNNMGGEKFDEEFAKSDGKALSDISQSGLSAQRNISRINRLDDLLARAPQGATASWKQWAGEYGVNTEGLDNIQSAQALINSLVPEQRPPGSGPMSDADLALFKQSIPRIINQPGGNKLIINTMRAVAQYDAEGATIVQKLRRGEIDRATAFDMLQSRLNPLDQLNDLPSVNDIDEELKKRGVQ